MSNIKIGKENLSLKFFWEIVNIHSNVDVDVSCVLFDSKGRLFDAVYYNNLDVQGCIHSGDVRGEGGGENEIVKIVTNELDDKVHSIVFSIHCYTGGTLRNLKNAKVSVYGMDQEKVLNEYKLIYENNSSLIFGVMSRNEDYDWTFRKRLRNCNGRNFHEVLDDLFESTNFLYPDRAERDYDFESKFNMIKSGIVNIGNEPRIFLSMGWDELDETVEVDLDASLVAVNKNSEVEYMVWYDDKKSPDGSIIHYGDAQAKNEKSQYHQAFQDDNELISVKLGQVPTRITFLFFVITVFDLEKTFEDIDRCWVRILNNRKEELLCYEIDIEELRNQRRKERRIRTPDENGKSKNKNAKVMAKIFRNPRVPLKWKFEPMNVDFELSRKMNVSELAPILAQRQEYFIEPELSTFEMREVRKLKSDYSRLCEERKAWVRKFHDSDFLEGIEILREKEFQELKNKIIVIENLTDVECSTPLSPPRLARKSSSMIFVNHKLRFKKVGK